jgi:hypothetical protein
MVKPIEVPNKLVRGGEKIVAFNTKTMNLYATVKDRMHVGACSAFVHAAQYGDVKPLNAFFDALGKAYQNGLRVWAGQCASIEQDGQKGSWLTFSSKDGFKVKKGTERYRVDQYDDTILNEKPFFADKDNDVKEYTLESLLKAMNALRSRMEKEEENNERETPFQVPDEVKAAIIAASAVANEALAKVKPANEKAA